MPRNTSSGADHFRAVATMMRDVTFPPVTKHQNTSIQRKRFAAVQGSSRSHFPARRVISPHEIRARRDLGCDRPARRRGGLCRHRQPHARAPRVPYARTWRIGVVEVQAPVAGKHAGSPHVPGALGAHGPNARVLHAPRPPGITPHAVAAFRRSVRRCRPHAGLLHVAGGARATGRRAWRVARAPRPDIGVLRSDDYGHSWRSIAKTPEIVQPRAYDRSRRSSAPRAGGAGRTPFAVRGRPRGPHAAARACSAAPARPEPPHWSCRGSGAVCPKHAGLPHAAGRARRAVRHCPQGFR